MRRLRGGAVTGRLLLLLLLAACGGEEEAACEEEPEALVQEKSATVVAGGEALPVEVADDDESRRRGLQHRRCDVTGLVLVNDVPATPLPIWMCEVVLPLDLAWVRDGSVIHVEEAAPPCAAPCGSCPIYGAGVDADLVLETPAGTFPLAPGQTLEFVPET